MTQDRDVEVDVERLTLLLADRMDAIVPAGFSVSAADGMLWYSAEAGKFPGQSGTHHARGSGTYVQVNFGAHGDTAEDHLVGVAAQALDELQDFIDEATHDPWPGDRTPPRAYAQVRGSALHLWYGGPDIASDVVLVCEPIPLARLQRSG